MDFSLSEEHIMIRDAARDFARTELLPGVIERDTHQKFPAEQIKKMGELGFLGMMVSPEYGGGGMDTVSYALAMEEISKIDASASVVMSVNNSLVCYGIKNTVQRSKSKNTSLSWQQAKSSAHSAFQNPKQEVMLPLREPQRLTKATITSLTEQKTGLPTAEQQITIW